MEEDVTDRLTLSLSSCLYGKESTMSEQKAMKKMIRGANYMTTYLNNFRVETGERDKIYNPYKPLNTKEIMDQLATARKHANEGKVMDAHKASEKIREKYGL